MGLQKGTVSPGSLLSQLLLLCQICVWTLNHCFLGHWRPAVREEWCVRDVLLAFQASEMYGHSPDRCWDPAGLAGCGADASKDNLFASSLLCFHVLGRNMCESIRHTQGVLFSPFEMCCAALRLWCSHRDVQPIMGTHSGDRLRVAENSHLLSNKGEKSWLSENKASKSPRNCIFTPKKILKSLIQS